MNNFFRAPLPRTGLCSLRKDHLAHEPFTFPNLALSTTLTVLLVVGVRRALHLNPVATLPLLVILASYLLVYYFAHSGSKYRHPIDPICALFIGHLASSPHDDAARECKGVKTDLVVRHCLKIIDKVHRVRPAT
jgi:hypothetical protein